MTRTFVRGAALPLVFAAATAFAEAEPAAPHAPHAPPTGAVPAPAAPPPAPPPAPADEPRAAQAEGTDAARPDAELERDSSGATGAAEAEAPLSEAEARLLEQALDQSAETILIRGDDRVSPGSAHVIGEERLERFEHDDPHRILGSVPGVYLREEDGYGLRPNIGMRGVSSERSAKIALMEDGILLAPAPYSAPAAYYFPLMTRMARVEVVKGSASVRHGPNTVGGAVNLVSAPIPAERKVEIDTAAGADLYGKVHAGAGDSFRHVGYWIEGIKLHSDGFKELDGGGDTGFSKTDLLGKLRVNSAPDRALYNQLELKLGYSDEVSNETYTGLATADFDGTPYRRYAATQLDRLEWDHFSAQLSHRLEVGGAFDLVTTAYRQTFHRDWRKLNGFASDRSLADILASPEVGNNAVYYAVLTGQADSMSEAENLILGTNARDYVSQGVQTVFHTSRRFFGLDHELTAGVRLHLDSARRFHTEDDYRMQSGSLVRTERPTAQTEDSTGSARAWALFAQDSATFRQLTVTAGVRSELVSTRFVDRLDPAQGGDDFFAVVIPGGGAFYRLTDHLGVLAGVHRGFVPVAPGQDPSVRPEKSWNYEAGARYGSAALRAELVGFYTDYQNLKGACSFSAGCTGDMVTDEFNGGDVRAYGLEAMAEGEVPLGRGFFAPLRMSYTLNRAEFLTSFRSDNPQWGAVDEGDELPYLPEHQLSLGAGVLHERFELAASATLVGSMRDVAGQGEVMEEAAVPGHAVFDLAASVSFGRFGRLYATVDNVLDQAYIVSRRPVGARPGKPRLVVVGYKNGF